METIKITRRELRETKRKISAANTGLSILKVKKSALIIEFFRLLDGIKSLRGELYDYLKAAQDTLMLAESLVGSAVIEKVAEEQSGISLSGDIKNVMGINISELYFYDKDVDFIEMPTPVYDARKYYVKFFSFLIMIAERERQMKIILKQIYDLNRRVNSLQYRIIPKWSSEIKYISERLEDMERDRLVSIKFWLSKYEAD